MSSEVFASSTTDSVVRNVPDQLLPAGQDEVLQDPDLDLSAPEVGGQGVQRRRQARGALLRRVLGHQHAAVVEVADVARPHAAGADEAEPAEDPVARSGLGGRLLRSQAVLEHQHHPVLLEHRRQHERQQVVLDGLQRHDGHVAPGHVLDPPIGPHLPEVEVTVLRIHPEAMGLHVLVLAAEKVVDVAAATLQAGPVEAPHGSGSEDGVGSCWHGFVRQIGLHGTTRRMSGPT
jgi:hypothetical protein